jgi:hypothetical protein
MTMMLSGAVGFVSQLLCGVWKSRCSSINELLEKLRECLRFGPGHFGCEASGYTSALVINTLFGSGL